ncbi:hypothetical protein L7F22_054376 [Adiantum nelumboides]|nr:hypothetical protein [Adiantum nelumboides]
MGASLSVSLSLRNLPNSDSVSLFSHFCLALSHTRSEKVLSISSNMENTPGPPIIESRRTYPSKAEMPETKVVESTISPVKGSAKKGSELGFNEFQIFTSLNKTATIMGSIAAASPKLHEGMRGLLDSRCLGEKGRRINSWHRSPGRLSFTFAKSVRHKDEWRLLIPSLIPYLL